MCISKRSALGPNRLRAFSPWSESFRSHSNTDCLSSVTALPLEYPREPFKEVPYHILERILDSIATDRDLIDEPLQPQIPSFDAPERQRANCLRALSLVHRSWTIPSQQRLAGRIVARSPSAILRLLRSPLPNHHTRELVVALGDVWNHGSRFGGTEARARPGEVEADLCSHLRRLPQLRSLTLKESGLREDLLLPIISKIGTLQSLSWHCAHGYPSCDFAYLADALR